MNITLVIIVKMVFIFNNIMIILITPMNIPNKNENANKLYCEYEYI